MRVLIAGGGTGGHVYPGLAMAQRLLSLGAEVVWLGARAGLEARKLAGLPIPHKLLSVSGAVGVSLAAKARSFLRLGPAFVAARAFLARVRPDVVLSVGGYAAFPGAAAAAAAGIPLVIQEQNAWPGLTHRLMAPWAAAIACGFPQAVEAFPSLPARFTGNPVREEFFHLPPAPEKPNLLVLGGSQGSQVLNRLLPEAMALVPPERRPQLVHQAGEKWEQEVKDRYQALGVAAHVVGFMPQPWEALQDVPLVVARAGALTVCELAAAGRAAILVPFARAAHGHQLANARALAATGAAWVVEEEQATAAVLANLLTTLFADLSALARQASQAKALARPDATAQVVDLLFRASRKPREVAA